MTAARMPEPLDDAALLEDLLDVHGHLVRDWRVHQLELRNVVRHRVLARFRELREALAAAQREANRLRNIAGTFVGGTDALAGLDEQQAWRLYREQQAESDQVVNGYLRENNVKLTDALAVAQQDTARLDDFLTEQVNRGVGVVAIGLTEHGQIGVWLPVGGGKGAKCDGSGDTALAACLDAMPDEDAP